MFKTTRMLAAATIAFSTLLAGTALSAEKLTIASEGAYPPFNTLNADGTLVGFDIDIARALCDEMKVECNIITNDWDGMIPGLQAKKFDAIIASMSITEERLQKVDFSDKYYNTGPALAVPKDSPVTKVEELDGKTIGYQVSTTHANYAEKHIKGAELKLYPTSDEAKLDISNGRIDAIGDDIVVLSEWLNSDAGACCKLLVALPIDEEILGKGAGIAVRKGETELAKRFSDAIVAIRANGKYKEVNDKYFDFDAYGE